MEWGCHAKEGSVSLGTPRRGTEWYFVFKEIWGFYLKNT